MKRLFKLSILILLITVNSSCENDGGNSDLHLNNGALSNFTIAEGSPDLIVNTTFPTLELKFRVDSAIGDPESFDLRLLYTTIDGDAYGPFTLDANVTTYPKDYVISGTEVINAIPEISNALDMNAGDNILFYTSLTMKDGTVLETLNASGDPNYYASDFNQIDNFTYFLSYPVICAPQPGVYTIDMHDSYGDGWQTNDALGGNGIQLILDGVITEEVGLCSPYVSNSYSCTNEYSNGSSTLTIPEGTEVAIWQFPGDNYGEIGFEIYAPDGTLLLTSGFGEAVVGPLSVILCAGN